MICQRAPVVLSALLLDITWPVLTLELLGHLVNSTKDLADNILNPVSFSMPFPFRHKSSHQEQNNQEGTSKTLRINSSPLIAAIVAGC